MSGISGLRTRRASCALLAVQIVILGVVGSCSSVQASSLADVSGLPRACTTGESVSRTQVITLGTAGGPVLRQSRSQPANLLMANGVSYLVDAGDGVAQQLTIAGAPIPEIRQVFLTHLHADHVAGLAPLLLFAWTSGAAQPLTVYGPPGTEQLLETGLRYIETPVNIHRLQYPPVKVPAELFSADEPFVGDGTHPTLIYEDENVRVYAVENSHYSTMPPVAHSYGFDRSYAYRFDTSGRSVVFSGDSGPSDALASLAEGADVLVVEVIDLDRQIENIRRMTKLPDEKLDVVITHMAEEHISPEQIGMLAARAGVGQVVLTHVVPGLDGEYDSDSYLIGIRRYFGGPVELAADLDCF